MRTPQPQHSSKTAFWNGPPIRPNSAWKALGVIGPSRSVMKTCDDAPCSRCRRLRARISSPCIDGHSTTRSGPADVEPAGGQLDLRPLQIAQLGRPQAVAIANQDHGCIPMAVAARLPGGPPSSARSLPSSGTRGCELRNLQWLAPTDRPCVFPRYFARVRTD